MPRGASLFVTCTGSTVRSSGGGRHDTKNEPMSTSPFMTPSHRRRRREVASRRRRRRRALFAVAVALVLVAAVVVMASAGPGAAHESKAAAHRRSNANAATATPGSATRSPIGLPLGKPALALKGIGGGGPDSNQDPVRPSFHEQPHAGILFNLNTGQVLWQHNAYTRLRIASLTKMMTALLTVTSAPPDAP